MVDYDKVFAAAESKKHLYSPNNDIQALFDRSIVMADAAHSFGSSYHKKKSGAVADFTNFSLHGYKICTALLGSKLV